MPDIQGSYLERHGRAYEGMIAETQFKDVTSYLLEGANVGYGRALGHGTAENQAKLNGSGFIGITVRNQALNATNPVDTFVAPQEVGLIRRGTVWVITTNAVVPGDPVSFNPVTGALSTGAGTVIENAKFETTAAADGLARVYLG